MTVAACQRQVEPLPLPPIEIIGSASKAEMAAAEIRDSPIDLKAVVQRRGFALMGLEGNTETDLTLENEYISRLGGYFDGSKVVLLVNRSSTDADKTKVLLHELVHVLQVPDVEMMSKKMSFDEFLANRAVVEGEATLIADLAVLDAQGVSPADVDLESTYLSRGLPGHGPNIITDAYSQFTYSYGAYFMSRLRVGERREVWQHMPTSTREVMHPWLAKHDRLKGVSPQIPVLPASFTRMMMESLGNWIWQSRWRESLPSAVRSFVCPRFLPDIAQDTFSVFHDEASGEIVSAWRVRVAEDDTESLPGLFEELKACYERRPDILVGVDDKELWIVATSRPDRAPPVLGWEAPRATMDDAGPDSGADAADAREADDTGLVSTVDASRDAAVSDTQPMDAIAVD
ncbi:MAG: hypothetical protein SF187_20270 [Deltaproteobacteria bacterium]|nr:hypothetical protein [Deltaproteobacteria bacterium]